MTVIHVQFGGYGVQYAFKYSGEEVIKVGDQVVVDADGRFQVAKVVRITETTSKPLTKHVLCRVPVEEHLQRLQRDTERKLIQAELDKKIKAFEQDRLLNLLVSTDPEAAKLVKQLEELK